MDNRLQKTIIKQSKNEAKAKIYIEYDKVLKNIEDKDKHINLQEQLVKELNRLIFTNNVTYSLHNIC